MANPDKMPNAHALMNRGHEWQGRRESGALQSAWLPTDRWVHTPESFSRTAVSKAIVTAASFGSDTGSATTHMSIAPHPDFRVQKLRIGREQAPLVVIDNLVADADKLVEMAAGKTFVDVTNNYPGVRTKTPLAYQQLVRDLLRGEVAAYFGLDGSRLHFTACHFSLVTTPPAPDRRGPTSPRCAV